MKRPVEVDMTYAGRLGRFDPGTRQFEGQMLVPPFLQHCNVVFFAVLLLLFILSRGETRAKHAQLICHGGSRCGKASQREKMG